MRNLKAQMSISLLALLLSASAFAGTVKETGESEKKTIITDVKECKGDIFCVDNMRVTCNARKEVVNKIFDRTVIESDGDLRRDDVSVEAIVRKNGKNKDADVTNIKKVECVLTLNSVDHTYLFRDSVTKKSTDLNHCRSEMENNIKKARVLFQESRDGRNLLLKRTCRVYLLELIKK